MSSFDWSSIPRLFWFILGALFVLVVAIGIRSENVPASSSAQQEATETSTAPDFTLTTVDGDTFHLREHRGHVVVLNFWATWCPPCRREIPHFVKLQRELGDMGLQFVGVALERSAGTEEVSAFAEKMNINYPIGLGDGSISQKYGGVRRLPKTFIIGPKGKIRGRIPGMTTESMIRPKLESLLEEVP